jgi:hypothetical protein
MRAPCERRENTKNAVEVITYFIINYNCFLLYNTYSSYMYDFDMTFFYFQKERQINFFYSLTVEA